MKEVQFKVGDLVYCPEVSHKILKIDTIEYDCIYFEVGEFGLKILTNDDSLIWENWIFHATQENYELLFQRYPNVTFEPPPLKRKEPKEIIEDMLNDGYHGVLCQIAMVDEDDDSIVRCYRYDYALEVLDDKIIFSHHTMYNDQLKFVSPFHQKSGMEIVYFINGKIVLQNGEVVLES